MLTFPSQVLPRPNPPDIIEGDVHYEVETILDAKKKRGKLHFLVKWLNYPNHENSWEPYNLCDTALEYIEEFYDRNPRKPGHNEWRTLFEKLASSKKKS